MPGLLFLVNSCQYHILIVIAAVASYYYYVTICTSVWNVEILLLWNVLSEAWECQFEYL